VALVLLGWGLYPVARLSYQQQRDRDRLQQQLAALRTRNTKLKQQVDRLKTPQGVEEAARQLGLARKGEQVWITMPAGKDASSAADGGRALQDASVVPVGVVTRALDALFGVEE
jgi:cell division protein FtsL